MTIIAIPGLVPVPPVIALFAQRHAGQEKENGGSEQGTEHPRGVGPREGVGRVEGGRAGDEEAEPQCDFLGDVREVGRVSGG